MQLALAVLAFGLLALPEAPSAPSQIKTRVHLLQMDSLDWRGQFYERLQVVSQQGPVTIWTGDCFVSNDLKEAAESCVAAPAVTSSPDQPASIAWLDQRHVITGMKRIADGPAFAASQVAFCPLIELVPDGMRIEVTGRPLDQGVLCQITIDESQILGLHAIAVHDGVKPQGLRGRAIRTDYQMPELQRAQVAGEWVVPSPGVLVFGLGARTLTDPAQPENRARVCERLVLVEATCMAAPEEELTAVSPTTPSPLAGALASRLITNPAQILSVLSGKPRFVPGPRPTPATAPGYPNPELRVAYTPTSEPAPVGISSLSDAPKPEAPAQKPAAPMPRVPSRAVPKAFASDGTPVELPALPIEPPITEDSAGNPIGTPQTHKLTPPPGPAAANLAQTDRVYTIEAEGSIRISSGDQVIEATRIVIRVPDVSPTTLELDGPVVLRTKPAAAPSDRLVRTTSALPGVVPNIAPGAAPRGCNVVAEPVAPTCPPMGCCSETAAPSASDCCTQQVEQGTCPQSCVPDGVPSSSEGCEDSKRACDAAATTDSASMNLPPAPTDDAIQTTRFSLEEAARLLKATSALSQKFHLPSGFPHAMGSIEFELVIGHDKSEKP